MNRIDLTKALYAPLMNDPRITSATPKQLMIAGIKDIQGSGLCFNIAKATEEYIWHIADAFAPSGATISDDGCTATIPDGKTNEKAFWKLMERAEDINFLKILSANRDDGWFADESGHIYTPDMWDAIEDEIDKDSELADTISERFSPCDRQTFFTAYAKAYKDKHGEEWNPSAAFDQD